MDSKARYIVKKYPEFILKLYEMDSFIVNKMDPLLTFAQTCAYLKYSRSYLYKLCERNLIPHYNPNGRTLFFRKSEIDNWLIQKSKCKKKNIRKSVNIVKHKTNFK